MASSEADTVEVHPVTFPPQVLARISPELSLQRHLSLGIRPSLKRFEEFRDVHIDQNTLSRYKLENAASEDSTNSVLGSNVLKSGKTFVITSITGGIVEETLPVETEDPGEQELEDLTKGRDEISKFAPVYPLVEVERGRVGAPTDEEMTISQKLHDYVLHSGLIPKSSLKVQCGVRTTEKSGEAKVLYPDEDVDVSTSIRTLSQRKWSYVLYAKIVVFSRTGPVFDLCWNSLLYALQDTRLPRAFIDERATDLKMTIRTRGRSASVRETYEILCDPRRSIPLKISRESVGYASSFGVIDLDPEMALDQEDHDMEKEERQPILLADLDTEAEEACIQSTICIITDSNGNLKNIDILGGGARVTPAILRRAINLAQLRARNLEFLTAPEV
ncbi:ZYRO0C17864p [Zygosaccharomyces rouxii]|uniref:Ribosomal RNA-processing protein 43 n=2 Tax=Zygosaccharomyces rouxii TaxID=4956 RepID=C5DUM0_ZYGRC|nr:uncharacterized protein ZYRO0C17864g [Zygosaccharomyces rouxii]KAH9201348.1 exosome complex exonuclease RRP43 [Zygosaccharomyces rouxii]CAQ43551.1 Exosome complex exonuclease RRP43 [Zygosaccharomyces rouxii]CAR27481.1 ZYRO0C17864p [Zygosaccharomyces rouxii]